VYYADRLCEEYSQDVKFVLIDTEKNKIINQLDLEEDFEMPIITENEQLINMLDFKDYAHDGKACEFYVLSYMGCGNTDYQFIGYNPHTDKIQVIKYKIKITEQEYDAKTESYLQTDTSYTTEFNALSNVPLDKMVKKKTLKYSYYYGHGDDLTNFMDIKFDAQKVLLYRHTAQKIRQHRNERLGRILIFLGFLTKQFDANLNKTRLRLREQCFGRCHLLGELGSAIHHPQKRHITASSGASPSLCNILFSCKYLCVKIQFNLSLTI
jgi:hypothetical protein